MLFPSLWPRCFSSPEMYVRASSDVSVLSHGTHSTVANSRRGHITKPNPAHPTLRREKKYTNLIYEILLLWQYHISGCSTVWLISWAKVFGVHVTGGCFAFCLVRLRNQRFRVKHCRYTNADKNVLFEQLIIKFKVRSNLQVYCRWAWFRYLVSWIWRFIFNSNLLFFSGIHSKNYHLKLT